MSDFIVLVIISAILGAGLITGLLFAFSNFVMNAFADLPIENGMFAMQKINEKIINPIFMLVFLGTAILCAIIVIYSIQSINGSSSILLLFGAIAYLIGPLGITAIFNVPLNNLLAKSELTTAQEVWPMYQKKWQRWNHIRTFIGVIAIVFMALGLANIEV